LDLLDAIVVPSLDYIPSLHEPYQFPWFNIHGLIYYHKKLSNTIQRGFQSSIDSWAPKKTANGTEINWENEINLKDEVNKSDLGEDVYSDVEDDRRTQMLRKLI
jgi:hypothetical protein